MPTISITLKCTLKEFYCGCMKTVSYKKQVIGLDGKTITQQTANKQVEIKPGMSYKTTFTFKGEGHQQPGHSPSDLFITLELVPPAPNSGDYYINSCY